MGFELKRDEVVVHANVRFDKKCEFCNAPFGKYHEGRIDQESYCTADAYGEYKCGTALESLVSLYDMRSNSYGPDRTFQQRLIEQSWSCKKFARDAKRTV